MSFLTSISRHPEFISWGLYKEMELEILISIVSMRGIRVKITSTYMSKSSNKNSQLFKTETIQLKILKLKLISV